MGVGGNGLQGEDLGRDGAFEVDHQSHGAGIELAHTDTGDVGVRGLYFAHQFTQGGVEFHAFNVHGQPGRRVDEGLPGFERRVRFERDPAVVGGGPDAHGQHVGTPGQLRCAQAEHQQAGFDQAAAVSLHGPPPEGFLPMFAANSGLLVCLR